MIEDDAIQSSQRACFLRHSYSESIADSVFLSCISGIHPKWPLNFQEIPKNFCKLYGLFQAETELSTETLRIRDCVTIKFRAQNDWFSLKRQA